MKISLGTKLHAGVAAAVLLALAATGAAWWWSAGYEDRVEQAAKNVAETVALAKSESALWHLRYGFPQFILGDAEERKHIVGDEAKWYAVIESNLEILERIALPGPEIEGLSTLRTEYLRYKEARPRFFELYGAGRTDEAIAWRALATIPYGVATVQAFDRQVDLVRAEVAEDVEQSLAGAARSRIVVLSVSGLLLLLLALTYLAALRALRPIRMLHARALSVTREHLGQDVEASAQRDEVEALVESFNRMSEAFVSRTAELERIDAQLRRQQEGLEQTVAARTAALKSRQQESDDLAELTSLMQTAEDVDDAARILPLMLGKLLAAHGGAVYLVRSSLNTLESLGHFGTNPEGAPTIDPGDCWALRRGHAYAATDPARDVFCGHVAPRAAPAGYVCVPMQARGAPIGLLHVALAAGLDAAERGQAQAHIRRVAEQVAVGLANLKLREALREQSIRDALTGLFNRRYLLESLEQELARVKREQKPLAVFMLDVDHFKRFNDVHGHEAGDAVLHSFGRLLKESARAGDTVCRYGGEEFTAVLSGASPDQARAWAERLMDRVRGMTVRTGGQALPGVTISMGLAYFPTEGEDVQTLLQAADFALYEAKRSGRDRLVAAGEVRGQTTLSVPATGS